MAQRRSELGVIVLAAGAGSRFGGEPGSKLLADLGGKAVLQHVLNAVRAFEPARTVVVMGPESDRIEQQIDWSGEHRVMNEHPRDGLSSSLAVGIGALDVHRGLVGAFIVLGDQPWLRADTMRDLAAAAEAANARPADRPLVVPRYDDPGPRNPVLLLRPAWPAAAGIEGDHGLAELIDANPDQVLEIAVRGAMPDVDTLADLARLESEPRP